MCIVKIEKEKKKLYTITIYKHVKQHGTFHIEYIELDCLNAINNFSRKKKNLEFFLWSFSIESW